MADPNIDPNKETDDAMSLVRLMTYSYMFDIEGLVATCSHNMRYRFVEPIYDVIDAYEIVLPNLSVHVNGYPSPESLRSVTALGPADYGTAYALNEEPISDGAQIIIDAINRDDDRPIWISIWGDGAVLAQALEHIRKTEGVDAVNNAVSKLRVLDNAGQDDSGAWLMDASHYPDLWYLRWDNMFCAMDPIADEQLYFYPFCGECAKGDPSFASDEWANNNVRSHGVLGAMYPPRRYLKEGDTPVLLYLVNNGLNDPEQPWHGSWGGRSTKVPVTGIRSYLNLGPPRQREYAESDFDPYYMYGPAEDTWNGYTSKYATIFRWWEPFQNEFAAMMDWSLTPSYENVNHPPIVDNEILYIDAFKGDVINLSSTATDPDGDVLSYEWWYYKEPGTYNGNVTIDNPTSQQSYVNIPLDAENTEIHIILSVTDNGNPSLTRYKRVIISVFETFIDSIPPTVPRHLASWRNW